MHRQSPSQQAAILTTADFIAPSEEQQDFIENFMDIGSPKARRKSKPNLNDVNLSIVRPEATPAAAAR